MHHLSNLILNMFKSKFSIIIIIITIIIIIELLMQQHIKNYTHPFISIMFDMHMFLLNKLK